MYVAGNPAPVPMRSGPGIIDPQPPVAPATTVFIRPPAPPPTTQLPALQPVGLFAGPGQHPIGS